MIPVSFVHVSSMNKKDEILKYNVLGTAKLSIVDINLIIRGAIDITNIFQVSRFTGLDAMQANATKYKVDYTIEDKSGVTYTFIGGEFGATIYLTFSSTSSIKKKGD